MPAAAGRLQPGDRIRALAEPHVVYVVEERLSDDTLYAVRIRREDGAEWSLGGKLAASHVLLTAHWWVFRSGQWELLPREGEPPGGEAEAEANEDPVTEARSVARALLGELSSPQRDVGFWDRVARDPRLWWLRGDPEPLSEKDQKQETGRESP